MPSNVAFARVPGVHSMPDGFSMTIANTAKARANQERAARIQTEAQVRELEEQLPRLRGN